MANIQEFLQILDKRKGIAPIARFNVYMFLPQGLQPVLGNLVNDIPMQCEAAELPPLQMGVLEYVSYGPAKKTADVIKYEYATFVFLCTADFWERPFFEAWIDYINPRKSGYDFRYKDDYVGTVYVNQYDYTDKLIYQAGLQKAWPVAIYPMPMHWSDDGYHRMGVTFAYDRYLVASEYQKILQTTSETVPISFGGTFTNNYLTNNPNIV